MSKIVFDPMAISAVSLLCVSIWARRALRGRPRWYVVVQCVVFTSLTLLLRAYNIIPYEVMAASAGHEMRLLLGRAVAIGWWLVGAWLVRGFIRAFMLLEIKDSDATLLQEILSALIYVVAAIAILTYVLDLPIKGLLATSGALAIVVGLALQSSLGEAFSGIVLNLERPYRVGDWIIVDGTVQGDVIETNWRTTHIRTAANDLAIVPNSVIAKSKIVNCSKPTAAHNSSVSLRLDHSLALETARDLMQDVLTGCTYILLSDEPSVAITDISADAIEYQLGFAVSDVKSVDKAKADILQRAFYATAVSGGGFAGESGQNVYGVCVKKTARRRALESIPLFDSLTDDERESLFDQMQRRMYRAGEVIAERGKIMQSLIIVSRGVISAWEGEGGTRVESGRLTPGFYFGEIGLLTGEPLSGPMTALTQAVTYELSKEALTPILAARPAVADQLGETLELRAHARQAVLSQHRSVTTANYTISRRVADTIRRLFGLGG